MNFLEIQKQLSVMVGAASPAQLTVQDGNQIKQVINQMYSRCYMPTDGRRPAWAKQAYQLFTRKPYTAQVDFTAGSDLITITEAGEFPMTAGYAGSDLQVGKYTFHLSTVTDEVSGRIAEMSPISGIHTVTFHSNVIELPEGFIDVDGRVLMDGKELAPEKHEGPGPYLPVNGYPETCYTIDSSLIGGTTKPRLRLFPSPSGSSVVELVAHTAPKPLVADTDVPVMPARAIDECLVPMARTKYAEVSPRYNGKNIRTLQQDRAEAEALLAHLASAQKGSSRRMRLRTTY